MSSTSDHEDILLLALGGTPIQHPGSASTHGPPRVRPGPAVLTRFLLVPQLRLLVEWAHVGHGPSVRFDVAHDHELLRLMRSVRSIAADSPSGGTATVLRRTRRGWEHRETVDLPSRGIDRPPTAAGGE